LDEDACDQPTVKNLIETIIREFEAEAKAHFQFDYLGFFSSHYDLIRDTVFLEGIVTGKKKVTESKELLVNSVLSETELDYLLPNVIQVTMETSNHARLKYLDWFFSLLENVQDDLPAPLEDIKQHCEAVFDQSYLRVFRPVLGTNKIFRGMQPAAYQGDPRLERWFIDHDIKTIIDLRRPDEVEKDPDDYVMAEQLGQQILEVNFNADEVPAHNYVKALIGCDETVKQMFEAMLSSAGNVLVHCGAGKDRTGIVSALVELLVGVPEEDIIADYLRSGQDTRPDRISQTLDYIKKQGGIQAYLNQCGFTEDQQQAFAEKFSDQPES
jgi:protein tyrosine phosphatase (PTP) superfamily phosphohydrolase (DUF442 family)